MESIKRFDTSQICLLLLEQRHLKPKISSVKVYPSASSSSYPPSISIPTHCAGMAITLCHCIASTLFTSLALTTSASRRLPSSAPSCSSTQSMISGRRCANGVRISSSDTKVLSRQSKVRIRFVRAGWERASRAMNVRAIDLCAMDLIVKLNECAQ